MDGRPAYEATLSESAIFQQLPNELAQLIRTASGSQLLDALALGALEPSCTEGVFALYEPIFVDLAARWLSTDTQSDYTRILSAFSRILPFAPYLRIFASQYIGHLPALAVAKESSLEVDVATLRSFLLAIFRLLSFDPEAFSNAVSPLQLQSLFQHGDRSIRYLAVRCFCIYIHAADMATERMISAHVGDEPVEGMWEGSVVDYRFLSLWEERRWQTLEKGLQQVRLNRPEADSLSRVEALRGNFKKRTADICGVLVPRLQEISSTQSPLVQIPTAVDNLRRIARSLLLPRPLLLMGLSNSGKTSLVNHIAGLMGQADSMVTLHLNEQTDAKSLLGMYATSSVTGSFTWQPGVLTKAAREGRWVLIEDLERAPSEVIGLILPVIEKGELIIPSRRERIKCADGFRIIATMKTSLNATGEEVMPSTTILGSRLWERVQVDSPDMHEIRDIITEKFPLLSTRVPMLMDVYTRICSAFRGSLALRSSQGRSPGLRDLIKLCDRSHRRLERLGIRSGHEATPESLQDEILMDTVDVFIKYLPDRNVQDSLAAVVAEALHVSPQRAHFCLHERTPAYSDSGNSLQLGRELCQKLRVPAGSKSRTSTRFAPTRPALKTMEQAAAAIQMAEPLLLVGETGIGKTAVIQQLATLMRQKLTVVNLSQQSESTDLLGGFKPVNIRSMAVPMLDDFSQLFEMTFSAKKNQKFLSSVAKSVAAGNWTRLVTLWHEAVRMANGIFGLSQSQDHGDNQEQPAKKRKLDSPKYQGLRRKWEVFAAQLSDFEAQVAQGDTKFTFAFVQGKIVRALRNGEWVLLDEINLASPDTLENIASLLHHGSEGSPSVLLSEAGDVERVVGHPDFRIFGAMNPATDAGKRDLAPSLRSRFTEIYVHSPDGELDDLLGLVQTYLGDLTISDLRAAADLAHLYMEAKSLNAQNRLTDGAGQKPHFSIRTLVRTLIYVIDHAQIYGLRRSMFEGFCMSFLTVLSQESERLLMPVLEKHIFGSAKNVRSLLGQTPRPPNDGREYVQFKHYWMRKGPFNAEEQPHYIITPFIEKNLKNLVRASSTRRFPILIQGPTSAGKTSMIEYLAKISGNKFVRINNHEHTDLQEYLGSYVSTDDGTLRYQEGILVEALRNGYWIVLDELNLAPSDVLEALNRLLDDNRELFIPETQEVVHPHPNFMLFATQNPAGLYGGRKVLSRAFRNRFLELHFDDIPESELEYILKERSQIAPSFCSRIVSVYQKLSVLRQSNRLFEQKNSFATLRDLFRWALRRADTREQLALNGFMLLAERVRNPQERDAVKKVIEDVMRVPIDDDAIYGASQLEQCLREAKHPPTGIVWTKAMRRLFILVSKAIENNEPVLLVGETGCGKTQLCQALAEAHSRELFIVNAHVNMETGDLIGAQRPLRNRTAIEKQLLQDLQTMFKTIPNRASDIEGKSLNDLRQLYAQTGPEELQLCSPELLQRIKRNFARSNALFEWSDGSLVSAMKTGQYFLLDEISLADDSVLERLNSVLEPSRTLLLAEKGPIDSLVVADEGFQFLATMNPGGDYGKKELSAALRNRLTEIWAPQLSEDEDLLPILTSKLVPVPENIPKAMLAFAKWFKSSFQNSSANSISIRDVLAWVDFINKSSSSDLAFAIVHGAAMVYIDTLGANPAAMLSVAADNLVKSRDVCLGKLSELFGFEASPVYHQAATVAVENGFLRVGPFHLPMGADSTPEPGFIMDAPTTIANSVRIARGLQSSKPILLEGSPGVGKTTLVAALARALGKPLTRINLSDQTDLTDLFGSDVPVEGGDVGQFAWRDAPFLRAMQRGGWVLLDEMNLASQSVLEGLNSCLDHRQQVYIAELDQTFKRHPDFVLFAAQNPHHQGGGRKGLPASFVNRFTVVYADSFSDTDLKRICTRLFPGTPQEQTDKLISFVSLLNASISQDRRLGAIGGPWEINLRDISRWLQLADRGILQIHTRHFLDVVISQRFRTEEDRSLVSQLYRHVFGENPDTPTYYHNLSPGYLQVGFGVMQRDNVLQRSFEPRLKIIPRDLSFLQSLILCIEQGWPSILVGPSGCGKTTVLRKLAAINGTELIQLALSADTDTMDLVGGFEQIDFRREILSFIDDLALFLQCHIITAYSSPDFAYLGAAFLQVYEHCKREGSSLENVLTSVSTLLRSHPHSGLEEYVKQGEVLLKLSRQSEKVGFQWTEGVLTQAIQQGKWVVLDNANLCNPSVLDRLNSLMEPNGYLVLNEQRTEDGSARIIKPHPNFRLFLTMDPRNGELSRAMRNRSIEICFLSAPPGDSLLSQVPAYTCESALYRLRPVWDTDVPTLTNDLDLMSYEIRLDHLSLHDLTLLGSSLKTFVPDNLSPPVRSQLISIVQRYTSVMEERQSWGLSGYFQPFDYKPSLEDVPSGTTSLITKGNPQPIHPLVNEPLLAITSANMDPSRFVSLAFFQEIMLDLYRLQQHLAKANEESRSLKPSQMTRLERSLASGRVQALMKDSTQPVGPFLIQCCQALHDHIRNLGDAALGDPSVVTALKCILHLCWDFFAATQVAELDDGEFQTYLQIAQGLASSLQNNGPLIRPISSILAQSISHFQAEWALTTGLSMQKMWDAWRPATPASEEQLQSLLDLEQVVSEFTAIAVKTRVPLSQLSKVRESLIDAQRSVIVGAADGQILVPGLKQVVNELATAVQHFESLQKPYFSTQFETICQYHDLSVPRDTGSVGLASPGSISLLASRPARPTDTSNVQSHVPDLLHKLSMFSGSGVPENHALSLSGTLSLSTLERLTTVGNTTLGQMDFLNTEYHALAHALSSSTNEIAAAQSNVLVRALARLALELLVCHEEFFQDSYLKCLTVALRMVETNGSYEGQSIPQLQLNTALPTSHYFRDIAETFLSPCLHSLTVGACSLADDIHEVGKVTEQLAMVLLRLFVPDRPFDPSLSLAVQRKRYHRRVTEVTKKSEAISAYERGFSGESTNLRNRLLQCDLEALGSEPPSSAVTRPERSQISHLQGEFSNLINSVLVRTMEDNVSEDKLRLLRDNIRQISNRLSTNFRFYDDITVPVIRFLHLLDLGISLRSSQVPDTFEITTVREISMRTPFLGGDMHSLSHGTRDHDGGDSKHLVEILFHELSILVTTQNTDFSVLRTTTGRDGLRRIFDKFHNLWKAKLKEDQEKEAQRTEMYRYRGSLEDSEQADEDELRQLFPTYDSTSHEADTEKIRIDPKSVSMRLSKLHTRLFRQQDRKEALQDLVKDSSRLLGSVWSTAQTSMSPLGPKIHLSGTFLLLEDSIDGIERLTSTDYNFYTDSNSTEARRLVSLVLSIQSRFLQLQMAWPEHAALQDVITCCKEIFEFSHTEPVAKFLTKVEKLHAYVHEWQLVASREYSAASLYDELTNLIISWRRLELSTWAKLLDIEREKCEQDVSSWWFVAYETLFAAPLQMAQAGEDLAEHTKEVIATLEKFFLSTTIGQYSARLQLVENFRLLLLSYADEYPVLGSIGSALLNFLCHFKPFENVLSKTLIDGRQSLEKDIKQQIQLASWKDTNIAALRESARRSHYKLFKVVKKYRSLLGQPVETVLSQGMPEASKEVATTSMTSLDPSPAAPPGALAVCQREIGAWSDRPRRFRDPDATASNMLRVYCSAVVDFNVSEQLDGFMNDVIETMKELKSQTPKTLTEENKEDVQHLKTRKRRFYAEKLHQLFFMGIRRNMGVNLLEEQASVAQVLATTPDLTAASTSGNLVTNAVSYFHRFLDLVPRVRQAAHDYSEELSNVEVSRSTGSIEGLLFLLRKQRDVLSPALLKLGSLESTLVKMDNIWICGSESLSAIQPTVVEEKNIAARIIAWLGPMLGLASAVVKIHSKFSKCDSSKISDGLHAWADNVDYLRKSLDQLADLPTGLSSPSHDDAISQVRKSVRELKQDLATWNQERPDLSFVLEQLISWTEIDGSSVTVSLVSSDVALEDFDHRLLLMADKMFVGLQRVSSTLSSLPSSVEDRNWLSRSEELLSKAIKEVHLSDITASLEDLLNEIYRLQKGNNDLYVASALVATVLPIVRQYYTICADLVNRFASIHRELCKMSYILAKSFSQIASEGFCSPAEASNEKGDTGELESGTGLGEGEGAEDISKDVQDDEDLSELAQQQDKEEKTEEMESSKDAVDMDQDELEGETGQTEQKEDDEEDGASDRDEEENDIDDEVGSVDDLDPNAVDEKLWDGSHEEEQKESENQEGKGVSQPDEQTAAQEKDKKDAQEQGEQTEDQSEDDEEAPEDEGEAVGREDMDVTDPHAKEEEALELPEEMQLDGEEKEGGESDADDGMDELSDMGPDLDEQAGDPDDKMEGDDNAEEVAEADDIGQEEVGEEGEAQDNNEAEGPEEEETTGDEPKEDEQEDVLRAQRDENEAAGENAAPSEAVAGGLAAEEDQNDDKGTSGDVQQENGSKDAADNTEQQNGAAEEGPDDKTTRDASGGRDDGKIEGPEQQAFKKLGDMLEQWHRKQQEIKNPSQENEESQALPQDTDMADAEFEHLADQEDIADTQALGQASEEQAKALDQTNAVESEDVKPDGDNTLPDVSGEEQDLPIDAKMDEDTPMAGDLSSADAHTTGTFMATDARAHESSQNATGEVEANEELDEVDSQLAAIHLSSTLPPRTSPEEARRLWSHYEAVTNNLSLSLTEQLRLILAPTLATKLRGDFRTGKRLNIKRIIPYIASQYKRDKIWMRRSIPSKRNYQIMLAVDDSKSMLESGSGQLAFETLALVAKSLSMLEVGDLCILGFGDEEHVRVAHEFGKPFSSEAGMQVFQQFNYQQTGTNVRKLIADSIALFREARTKRGPSGGSTDLWQLELVISDGICEDHDTIRRLVRQAQEERIMVVFIIVDAIKGSSILDLSEASFEPDESGTGEMKLKMKKYLEGFPFPYYLVVRDVRELPAVLAMALKQWFAEVVETSS
ncbi:AAA ATPase midasin [Paecilomyces lecythidis]|uniref:Midasin n=1 Tax=Paecilomyces lecythidis TaxID=3004212 RepID=A0ABR3Y753_9EURO